LNLRSAIGVASGNLGFEITVNATILAWFCAQPKAVDRNQIGERLKAQFLKVVRAIRLGKRAQVIGVHRHRPVRWRFGSWRILP
jgi:hypothetical protein